MKRLEQRCRESEVFANALVIVGVIAMVVIAIL